MVRGLVTESPTGMDAEIFDPTLEYWNQSFYESRAYLKFGKNLTLVNYFTNTNYRAALQANTLFTTSTPFGAKVDEGCQCGLCEKGWTGRLCDSTSSTTLSLSLNQSSTLSESRSTAASQSVTSADSKSVALLPTNTTSVTPSGSSTPTLSFSTSLSASVSTSQSISATLSTSQSYSVSASATITLTLSATGSASISVSPTATGTLTNTVNPPATRTKLATPSLSPHICSKQDMTNLFVNYPLFWFPPRHPYHGGYPIRFNLQEEDVRMGTAVNPFSENYWRREREKYWADDDPRWESTGPLYGFWDLPPPTAPPTTRPRPRVMEGQQENNVYSRKDEVAAYVAAYEGSSDHNLHTTTDILKVIQVDLEEESIDRSYNQCVNRSDQRSSTSLGGISKMKRLHKDSPNVRFMGSQSASLLADTSQSVNVTSLWLMSPFPIIIDVVYPGDVIPLIGRYVHTMSSSATQPNPYGFERIIEDRQASDTDGHGFPLIGIVINWTHLAIALEPLPTYSLGINDHVDIFVDTRYLGYCGGGSPAFTAPDPLFHIASFTVEVRQGTKEEAAKGIVFAGAILSGMAAPEAQAIAVISLMRCSNPKYQSLAKYRVLSPFAPFSEEETGLGNPGAGGPLGALFGIGMFISAVFVVQVLAVLGVRIHMLLRPLTREQRRALHNLGREVVKPIPQPQGVDGGTIPPPGSSAQVNEYHPPAVATQPAATTPPPLQQQEQMGEDTSQQRIEGTGGDCDGPLVTPHPEGTNQETEANSPPIGMTNEMEQAGPSSPTSSLRMTNIQIHRRQRRGDTANDYSDISSDSNSDDALRQYKTQSRFWNAEETDLVRSPVRSAKALRRKAGLELDHTTDEESDVEDIDRWELRQQEKEMIRMGLDPSLLHIENKGSRTQPNGENPEGADGLGSLQVPLHQGEKGSSSEDSDAENARYNELLALRKNELLQARMAEARRKAAERKRRLLEKRSNQLLTGSTKSPFVNNDINTAEIRKDLDAIPFDEYQHNRVKTFYDDTWIGACAKCYFPSLTLLAIDSSFLGLVILSIQLLQGYGEEVEANTDTSLESFNVYGRGNGRDYEKMVGTITLALCFVYAIVACLILPSFFLRRAYMTIVYPEPISRVANDEPLTDDDEEEMRSVERRAALKLRKEKRLREKAEKEKQQAQNGATNDNKETTTKEGDAKSKKEKREKREKKRREGGEEADGEPSNLTEEEREALRQKRKRDKKKKREAEAAAAAAEEQKNGNTVTAPTANGAGGAPLTTSAGPPSSPVSPHSTMSPTTVVNINAADEEDEEALLLKQAAAEAAKMKLPIATKVPAWAQYLFFPKGIIMSVETQRMFGSIISYSRWHPAWATMPLWSPVVLAAGGSFPIRSINDSYAGCITVLSFMAIFHFLFAMLVAVFGPYRYRVCNIVATMCYFGTALLLIFSAASINDPSNDDLVMASIVISGIQVFFALSKVAATVVPFLCFSSIMEMSTLKLEWVYFAPYHDFRDRARQLPPAAFSAAKSFAKSLSELADDMAMWCDEGEPVVPESYYQKMKEQEERRRAAASRPAQEAASPTIPPAEEVELSPQPPSVEEEENIIPQEPAQSTIAEDVAADAERDSLLGEPIRHEVSNSALTDEQLLKSAFNELDIDKILSDVEAERLQRERDEAQSSPFLSKPFLEAEESFVPFISESQTLSPAGSFYKTPSRPHITESAGPSSPTVEAISPILKKKKSVLRDRKVSIVEPHQLYSDDISLSAEANNLTPATATVSRPVHADTDDESALLGFPSRKTPNINDNDDDDDRDSLDREMGSHMWAEVENASIAFSVLDGSDASGSLALLSIGKPQHHFQESRPVPILTNSSITHDLALQEKEKQRQKRHQETQSNDEGSAAAAAGNEHNKKMAVDTPDSSKPVATKEKSKKVESEKPMDPDPSPVQKKEKRSSKVSADLKPEESTATLASEVSETIKEKKPKKDKSLMSPEELEAEAKRKKEKKEKKERKEKEEAAAAAAAAASSSSPPPTPASQTAASPKPEEKKVKKEKSSKK